MSLMLSEAREAPGLVEAALRLDVGLYAEIGARLRSKPPAFAATIARGSSDHAATYAASLIGIAAGRACATISPSLVTRYRARLALGEALVLGLSQSGASPDLVQTMAAARASGALCVTVVNTPGSPLAAEAAFCLPQHAGPERAVAATKSFILTLVAIARLVAAWTEDVGLSDALMLLPERLDRALACDWSDGVARLHHHDGGLYVVARGPALGIAQEAALKLKETSHLHAEALSAAEIRHGPRAVLDRGFPVLAFGLDDVGGADTRALAAELAAEGIPVMVAGGPEGSLELPLPAPLHPLLDPIAAILAFYPFAEALARARGRDPDRPRGLSKVTETL
jgi:glucosamine--fructose-6-phosphate aminotransferase (isomerizing)